MAPFRCQSCGKSFLTLEKFTIHSYSHTRERPFTCTKAECGKAFVSKYKLMRHMATHSPQKNHQCAHCEKSFNRKDHLKNHLQTHDPNKISYICQDCRRKYHTMLGYKRHMALHSASGGGLICKVCSAELGSTEVLLTHLKAHREEKSHHATREKKHQCDHCERCFYTRKDVRRHLVVHTGCKDFLCQFCAQRFGRKDHLTRHTKKTHSQELMQESMQAGEYMGTFPPIAPSFQLKATAMPPFQLGVPVQNGLAGGLPPEVHGLVLAPPEQVPQPMPPPMAEQLVTLHPGVVPTSPPHTLQEPKYSPPSTSFAPLAGLPIKSEAKGFCNMGFFEELPLQEPQSPLKLSPCFEMAKEGLGKVTMPKELLVDAVNITIPASLEISSLLGFWQIPPPPPQNGFVTNTIPMGPGEPMPHTITCLAQQHLQPPLLAVNLGQLPLPPIPHVFTTGTNTAILPHFHHAFR
uniref:C2H2-type domain-containing protein n=1 Tax=Peromyscus maniculatus bairdii TaxID=230844 RepID=A0A8C8W8H9_PERMB